MLIAKGGGWIPICCLHRCKEPPSSHLMLKADKIAVAVLSVLIASGTALAVSGTAFSAQRYFSTQETKELLERVTQAMAGVSDELRALPPPVSVSLLVDGGEDVRVQLRLDAYQVMMLDVLKARPRLLLISPHDLLGNRSRLWTTHQTSGKCISSRPPLSGGNEVQATATLQFSQSSLAIALGEACLPHPCNHHRCWLFYVLLR